MKAGSPGPGFGGEHQLPASLLAAARQPENCLRVLAAASPAWPQEHQKSRTGLEACWGTGT